MFHYPVIRTKRVASLAPALNRWKQFTHVIFTSQTAVEYWPGPWDKELIAIGPATAAKLPKVARIASIATQEGIGDEIANIKGTFFYPKSNLARPFLTQFMLQRGIQFFAFDLYETHFEKIEPVPQLEDFDEIVFTSPSTVSGFIQIYQSLPKNKKLTAIGPVTQSALTKQMRNMSNAGSAELPAQETD